ncbi:rhodanese-like domain-containing protein [Oceaniglobus roseus]|uniref:rhodanese-like domain-containing protein n=1 Tax=Oceaniglobus roseus TaxID=1737570 RepID=UPI000C7EFF5F|nr:rhodanese-like domain-containing protein [Kandeliimicrobium roseum]
MSGRGLVFAAGVACLGGAAFIGFVGPSLYDGAIREEFRGATLSAPEAFAMASEGRVVLVDIRRPEEWAATGSPGNAYRLDMRRDDFAESLAALIDRQGDMLPVALICARGVRSARLANRLVRQGFINVMDVPEGMLGSLAGPGWLARGLPLDRSPVPEG